MNTFAVVDRIENNRAVLLIGDEEEKALLPATFLPRDVGEGDYISISMTYDVTRTEIARKEAEDLLASCKGGR